MNKTSPEAKTTAWTDEAKFQFLLRVVTQLQRSGQSIKWDEINMPGRTPKSLQHMWAKIKTQVAELEKASGQQPSTPTKAKSKGAGTKRKAEAVTPEATPQKKRTALPGDSPVKKEEPDEDD